MLRMFKCIFNVFEPRQDLPANAGRKLRLCANHYLFIHPLHKSQVMKKRPIATAAPPGQRREWVMLWLTHLLIPWYSFLHFLRKPPSRHREKQSEARRATLAGFTELSTLRKNTNYLSSGWRIADSAAADCPQHFLLRDGLGLLFYSIIKKNGLKSWNHIYQNN